MDGDRTVGRDDVGGGAVRIRFNVQGGNVEASVRCFGCGTWTGIHLPLPDLPALGMIFGSKLTRAEEGAPLELDPEGSGFHLCQECGGELLPGDS